MTKLTLRDIWQALIGPDAATLGPLGDHVVSDVVIDSRMARKDNLFVALRGERTDGHLFLQNAFQAGAIAAIAEPSAQTLCDQATFAHADGTLLAPAGKEAGLPLIFAVPDSLAGLQRVAGYRRAGLPVDAIGITGSVGKTTTKETVANVLAQRYVTLRSEGNLNNEIGLPLTLLRLTPKHQRVVLEMGMYAPGEIARLCELAQPRIGIVTNVGPVHLERLGTIERIAQAKAELPQALPPADEGGVAILNADDMLVHAMAGLTHARVFTYGLNPEAELWADEVESQGLDGVRLQFHYADKAFHVRLPMLGRHSVHTALRGAAAGLVDGLSWAEILLGLQDVRGQLRLMIVPGLRETTLIDDTYNASPESMMAALNLLEDIANGHRLIAVLGDMYELGSHAEAGHRRVGGRAAQILTKLITVGTLARWIADEALACGMRSADVHPVDANTDAIGVLQGMLRPGDIILVKGSRAAAMENIVDALSRPRAVGVEPA